jgi:HAD superfamily hydrolase (TIGR01509 family)
MSQRIRAVLFDAGNTLIFPQIDEIVEELAKLGYPATPEDFYAADRVGKQKLDAWLWPLLRSPEIPQKADFYYWKEYLQALVERVGVPLEKQQEIGLRVGVAFSQISIWSRVLPGTEACLESLRAKGFYLAVISNSLGFIEAQLQQVGLARYFEFIFDSHHIGVEKPHPGIFRKALARCGCAPSEAVFVGDLYSTDIGGAAGAGMKGVLMDWIGAYPDAAVPRIESLCELDSALAALDGELTA